MNIIITYSQLEDYRKLIYTLISIKRSFFQDKGFLLSYSSIKDCPNCVVIPAWEKLFDTKTWDKIDINQRSYRSYDGTELPDFLEKLTPIDANNIQEKWKAIENEFLRIFNEIDLYKQLTNVEVYVTNYGAISSYIWEDNTLKILFRADADISNIAACILNMYVHIASDHKIEGDVEKFTYTWETKQDIGNFLLEHTRFKNLFENVESISSSTLNENMDPEVALTSSDLFTKLGFPIQSQITIKDGSALFGNKTVNLSQSELKVLEELITNRNKLVTYDRLSEILWQDDSYSKFSQEAISKVIERINKKLRSSGLLKKVIYTKRGKGYVYV